MNDVPAGNTFIDDIIQKEIKEKQPWVHTRFPPEPNGYLHVGHAKAVVVNFSMAKKYGGKCNLRMDDTNPAKEDMEYVKAICEDVKWLGFEWDNLLFASDYYEKLYECAMELIKRGRAFVCDLSAEQMREYRGTLTAPGKNSPWRDRSIEENINLFERMRAGEFADGEKVLRAKIDMGSPNINMRDPVIYRVMRATHYRTGDMWLIYPMYDFAHPLSDAFEGITHSLCTLEFEDHRPLYEWFLAQLDFELPPRQVEFARLNLTRTIMSKRYLKKLVDEGLVDGWDDPRMPTLSGMRRRGYTPEAILDMCERVGVAKSNSVVDSALLEHCVRNDLENKAYRMNAVTDPVKLVIENYQENSFEDIVMENMPGDEAAGSRVVPFGREVYIERADFMEEPVKKFFRLYPGNEVRLKGAYIVKCTGFEKDENGEISEVRCMYDPTSKSGEGARKVKGTLHWLCISHAILAEFREYDYLLEEETEENAGLDFSQRMNPNSCIIRHGYIEQALSDAPEGSRFQFIRNGYYIKDMQTDGYVLPVFNRIVGLRDSWAKIGKAD